MADEELEEETSARPWYFGMGALIGMSVSFLAVVFAVLVLLQDTDPPPEAASVAPIEIEDPDGVLTGALLRLEPITANIESTTTFLQLSVVFEYFELFLPADASFHIPRLRDAILSVLRTKTADELLSDEGKETLRLELIAAANSAIDAEDDIVDVYFEQFVLQSS